MGVKYEVAPARSVYNYTKYIKLLDKFATYNLYI